MKIELLADVLFNGISLPLNITLDTEKNSSLCFNLFNTMKSDYSCRRQMEDLFQQQLVCSEIVLKERFDRYLRAFLEKVSKESLEQMLTSDVEQDRELGMLLRSFAENITRPQIVPLEAM